MERETGWQEAARWLGGSAGDGLGAAGALWAERAVFGAPGHDGAGASSGVGGVLKLSEGPGINFCDSNQNSTGLPSDIRAQGSSSIADGDLTLIARHVPNSVGIFFYGPNEIMVPFNCSYLCVGGGINRFSPVVAEGNVHRQVVDFENLSGAQILPGSTWSFQCWFRDPLGEGTCNHNTSDGITISFEQ